MKVTLLGCGPAGGVPSISGGWGRCDPANPRNRRRRPSLLVEHDGTTLLVDTSPDMREQLLDAGVSRLDAVLFTHAHADHVHGIDDLREINRVIQAPLPAFASGEVLAIIGERFGYVFEPLEAPYYYKPVLQPIEITAPFQVRNIAVTPFEQDHGTCVSLGFRFGDVAYSTDLTKLDEAAFRALAGVRVWIVDAFTDHDHPTHASVDVALGWIERLRPERAVLTHMSAKLDYDQLKRRLPPNVEPGYDGMVLDLR